MKKYIPRALPKFLGDCLFQLPLLLAATATIVPLSPWMPKGGLDPSWVLGLNQALAQGLAFGKDIIFTCGPYASLYTRLYHPAIDTLLLAGSAFLALTCWLGLAVMMRGEKWRWHIAVSFVICLFLKSDAILHCYPLIACLACRKILNSAVAEKSKEVLSSIIVTIIFSGFGFIVLIKGSVLPLYCVVLVYCVSVFMYKKRRRLALLAICSFLAAIVIFWVAAGQPLSSLISYFTSMIPVISGYSEAMSVGGPYKQIILYGITYGMLLYVLWKDANIPLDDKWFVLPICLLVGFSAFKGGFTRHDGHAIMAASTLSFVVFILAIIFRSKNFSIIILACAVTWVWIDGQYANTSSSAIRGSISYVYSTRQPKQFVKWFSERSDRKARFDAALQSIRQKTPLPLLEGTSDIYSYDQADLIASGNAWSPRPTIQSHAAYTPSLLLANRAHLMGAAAPDNIFFRVQPIDNRLPSLDMDGASWPLLLTKYRFDGLVAEDVALLRKKETPVAAPPDAGPREWKTRSLGETVSVPRSEGPVFASIIIKPTLLGRLAAFFLKPAHLEITVRLADGGEKRFRFVSGEGETGFLISPLIETTEEFALLYAGPEQREPLAAKAVVSFVLQPRSRGKLAKWEWSNRYAVAFSEAEAAQTGSAQPLYAPRPGRH